MEKPTLAEVAAQNMLQMIQEKGYTAGQKLPTEAELSVILGVGRNTVREALRLLMSRNIINIRQGAGTFLSDKRGVVDDPLGFDMIEDRRKLTQDLIQIRIILEPPIAALAAQNATGKDIMCLEQMLLEVEDRIAKRKEYWEKDSQFHVQIAKCSHNLVIANLVPVITGGVQIFAGSVRETEYQQTRLSHRRIYEAIKNRKPVEAQQAMYFHLMYNENRYHEEYQSDDTD